MMGRLLEASSARTFLSFSGPGSSGRMPSLARASILGWNVCVQAITPRV